VRGRMGKKHLNELHRVRAQPAGGRPFPAPGDQPQVVLDADRSGDARVLGGCRAEAAVAAPDVDQPITGSGT